MSERAHNRNPERNQGSDEHDRPSGMRLKVLEPERPLSRADCLSGGVNEMRPCPWVSCRHHLGLEVAEKTGSIKRNGSAEDWDPEETCALDIAERGPETLEEVGRVMGLTRERVRQIEELAFAKIRRACGSSDDSDADDEPNEDMMDEIREMLFGVECSGFVEEPPRLDPVGAEEGPQGTFVVPDRIEPAEGIRRMFHKTMDARLREVAEREATEKGLAVRHAVRVMSASESEDEDDLALDGDRTEASHRARRGKRTALRVWTKKDRAVVKTWVESVRLVWPEEACVAGEGSNLALSYRPYVPPSDRPPLMTPGFGPPDEGADADDAESGVFSVKKPKRAKKPRKTRRTDGTKPGFGSADTVTDDPEFLLDLLDF